MRYSSIVLNFDKINERVENAWLLAVQLKGQSSSTGGMRNVHFSILSRLALGPTQPANPMGTGGCLL